VAGSGRAACELVCAAGAARRAGRAAAPDPAGRLPVPQGRAGGAGAAAEPEGRRDGRDHNGGGLAGALAGLPYLSGGVHRPRVCRVRAPLSRPVPGGGAADRADDRAGAGDVHRDHPPAPGAGHPGVGRDADPDPCHAARGAERCDPPRLDHRQPAAKAELPRARRPRAVVWTPYRVGQWRRSGERPPVAVWTTAQTATFLTSIQGVPAVCRLPPDRAARPAPRGGGRAALVRCGPGRQDRGDQPAAAAIRRAAGGVPAQDPAPASV
jgi:hypothetical protein